MTPELAAIVIAAISGVSALAVVLVNHGKLDRLHLEVNIRLTSALEAQRQLGQSEGRAERQRAVKVTRPAPRKTRRNRLPK